MMTKRVKLWTKVFAAVVLTVLFILLIYTDETSFWLTRPEGELITGEEVLILIKELVEAGASPAEQTAYKAAIEQLEDKVEAEENYYINYGEYCRIWEAFWGEEGSKESKALLKEIFMDKKYKSDFLLLKEDWYHTYKLVLEYYDLQETIKEVRIELLGCKTNLLGEARLLEGEILDADGRIYTFLWDGFSELSGYVVKAYVREERLLTCTEQLKDSFTLTNIWVMEDNKEGIHFFYKGYELYQSRYAASNEKENDGEWVADLTFGQGSIKKVKKKTEKLSGKILRLDEREVEIEGCGSYGFAEDCKGYRLYETLREAQIRELVIGYDFADFIIEDGEICSFLLVKKEEMETIRVLIRNSGFGSLYQETVEVSSQEDMLLTYGAYGNRKQERITAGEVLVFHKNSDYLKDEQAELMPVSNTGKIQVLSVDRSQGKPLYRGKLELSLTEEGIVLINEVSLEEYLYSVVPSEMPASYPMEALKAQAVCARTYAYGYILAPGLGSLGAHVDDSTAYQVYNNISEDVNSTKAVKETDGEILLYDQKPVNAYYYSTSCGYGADERVWSTEAEKELEYLQPAYLGENVQKDNSLQTSAAYEDVTLADIQECFLPEELADEEKFGTYITETDAYAFEKEEAWYRWSYTEEAFRAEALYQRLKERYQAVPEKILTYKGAEKKLGEADGTEADETIRELLEASSEEDFEAAEPKPFDRVYGMICTKRLPGGVLHELCVVTNQGTYKVIAEYNIRYILNSGNEIRRQDGSSYVGAALLPSAYFVLDVQKDDRGIVQGFNLRGGGYGHGAGMSQNGAKNMAAAGYTGEEILAFYFRNCILEDKY